MLKNGYSKKIIVENIRTLIDAGYSRQHAIVTSMNSARKSYFDKYPAGALPFALAYPKTHRLARHYTDSGAPIRENVRGSNPVRELNMSDAEREQIAENVRTQMTGQGKGLRKAAALYSDFSGHDDPQVSKVSIPGMPKELLAIGDCDGVLYSTVRDGVAEKYIHKFKRASRPLLCASPDGKTLYLIGGSYDFTERGIVDK